MVGSGGMGSVWRGHDLRLDRPVAIKLLAADALSDPTATERFDREARTVARLTHPNIVTVHDFGTDGGHAYLVMELVEGWSVAALLAHGPMVLSQAIAIAAQTCDGLTAAHAAGVIHRDVKPGNLLLTADGVVKICDFGIATLQHAAGQSNLTGPAVAMGSTNYMAPEQANKEPVDTRTDLYGLGCTLYAMLTGKPPFAAANPLDVVHLHRTQPPPPLRSRRPDVPAALATLVEQLLAKAPQDRPADALEVRTRLAALFEELAAGDAPTSDLQLAAVPQAAAVAGVSASQAVAPMAVSSAPEPGPARSGADRRVAGQPADLGGRAATRSPRRWRLAAVGVAAALAALSIPLLSVAGCLPTSADAPPQSAASLGVPPTAAPPAGLSPGPSPSASRSAAPSLVAQPAASPRPSRVGKSTPSGPPSTSRAATSPPGPTDPIVAMRLSIQQQVTAGSLTPVSALELYKKVDEIAGKLADGNTDDASKKIEELRDKLIDLYEHGKLSQAGYEALKQDVDRLDESVP